MFFAPDKIIEKLNFLVILIYICLLLKGIQGSRIPNTLVADGSG